MCFLINVPFYKDLFNPSHAQFKQVHIETKNSNLNNNNTSQSSDEPGLCPHPIHGLKHEDMVRTSNHHKVNLV